MLEPTDFNVFGIRIKEKDILNIRSTMAETYERLLKSNSKWEDIEFCKREISSLWDAIMDMLSRVGHPHLRDFEKGRQYPRLIVDEENQQFLQLFGKELSVNEALVDILRQLKETSIDRGSIRISFKDPVTGEKEEVRIEEQRLMKQVRKESAKIKNGLKYLVDWVRRNKRTLITCSLVAGIVVISLVAAIPMGAIVGVSQLIAMASLSVICSIYDLIGTYGDVDELKRAMERRLGFSHLKNL